MKRFTSVLLVVIMLASSFAFLVGPGTQTASADTVTIYSSASDGEIEYTSSSGSYQTDASGTSALVGRYAGIGYSLDRAFLSFDVSPVLGSVVTSASVSFYIGPSSGTFSSLPLDVYAVNYGETLDNSDWNAYIAPSSENFVGQFAGPLTATWMSVDISPSLLSGGSLQLEIIRHDESSGNGRWRIDMSESSNAPYIEIETLDLGALTYHLSGGSVYTTNVVPIISSYNATHDCYVYEFDTWSGVEDVVISKGSESWALLGVSPMADSILDGTDDIELGGVVTPATYRVYVTVPRTMQVQVHVGAFVSSTGEGFPFETFRMKYSPGDAYDSASALDIPTADFTLPYGGTYTIAVLDFFGNVIATQAFVTNAQQKYVSIPLDIHSFKVFNQQSDFTKFSIRYEGAGSALEFYVAPNEPVERFLRSGEYQVNVTRYSNTTAVSIESYEITVGSAQFLIIEGTTLSQIVSGIGDVYDRVDLVADSIVIINEGLSDLTRYANVYAAAFISSTGEGVPFETFRLVVNEGTVYDAGSADTLVSSGFQVLKGHQYTVTALDYFGNVLTSQTFEADAQLEYVILPIDVHSVKFFNQKEDFTRFSIYYSDTLAPMTFFCAPNEPVERFLRSGPYTVVVTYYNDNVASQGEYFNITVAGAEFLMIKGNTISRVISDVAGVNALQQVITRLVTPDLVLIKENMPGVPTEPVEYVHPWSVVTARTSFSGSGTTISFGVPYPIIPGATVTILEDKLTFAGEYSTEVWVNTTSGTVLYHSATLPASIPLDGQEVTVEASAPITVQRDTKFRSEELFYYAYYGTSKRYEVALTLNNTMGQALTQVDWFIGFPDDNGSVRSINQASVRIMDLDNAVQLSAGLNYDVTSAGIRMSWASLPASTARAFSIVFYDSNVTPPRGTPIAYTASAEATYYGGERYYLSTASWRNTASASYTGALAIKLDLEEAELIDAASIVVIDSNGNVLSPQSYLFSQGSITIGEVTVAAGSTISYQVYFVLNYDKLEKFALDTPLFVIGGIGVSALMLGWVLILASGAAVAAGLVKNRSFKKSGPALAVLTMLIGIFGFVTLLSITGAI